MRSSPFALAAAVAAVALTSAPPAAAAVIVLDFEGIGNRQAVGDYYDGGGGTNHGISFSPSTLALVDQDAGGTGNIANEPSGSTVIYFLETDTSTLSYSGGFSTGFAFFYSASVAATVSVYEGVGSTGAVLGSIDLAAQHTQNCSGDPAGEFCNWSSAGVTFAGVARSIDFSGTANLVAFDNITFGSAVAQPVPEPGSTALLLAGLVTLGVAMRRGRRRRLLLR